MSEDEIHEYMDEYYGHDVVQKGLDNTMLIYGKQSITNSQKTSIFRIFH